MINRAVNRSTLPSFDLHRATRGGRLRAILERSHDVSMSSGGASSDGCLVVCMCVRFD